MSQRSAPFERAYDVLDRAHQAFQAGIYENAMSSAYFAVRRAAVEIIRHKDGTVPKKHAAIRRRMFTLVWKGLDVDRRYLDLLTEGYKTMLNVDYGSRLTSVSREKAESFLDRSAAFLADAEAICR